METFEIQYKQEPIKIEVLGKKERKSFLVNLPGRLITLNKTKGRDGNMHWYEDSQGETPLSLELGKLIEYYYQNNMQKKPTIL